MNKQLVLAALFATAHAQTACDDANVRTAQAAKKALDARKASLETAKTSLATLAKTELAAYTAAKANYDAQDTVMAPFRTALKTASDNHKTQNDKATAATTALAALTAPLATRASALAAAKKAVTAQEALITAQKGVVAKLDAAVTEHKAEAKVLDAAKTAAGTAYTNAFNADAAKKTEYDNAKSAQDTAVSGTSAKKTAAGTAAGTANTTLNTKTSEESSAFGTYKTKKAAYDEAKKKLDNYTTACNSACGATGNPIGTLKTSATSDAGVATTVGSGKGKEFAVAKAAWDVTITALTAAKKAKSDADGAKTAADNAQTAQAKKVADTDTAYKALVKLTTAAKTAKDNAVAADGTVKTQVTQAENDQARGALLLTNLTNALRPLQDAVVIATHMNKLETDKKTAEDAKKAAAQLNLTDLANLKTMAQATVDRANIKLNFYKSIMDTAKSSSDAAAGQVTANGGALTKVAADIKAAEGATAVAVAACKGAGYTLAQTAVKALQDKQAAAKAAATKVKTDYDKVATPPTDGSADTRCEFPAKKTDGTQPPRKVCKETLCCGAAQKFMRDGTKIAVETCQKQIGTSTYTYYPPLPTGASVAPIPEVWRFACISGAQKLAATAAAALAAGYMMA